jgi:hypothetical protein
VENVGFFLLYFTIELEDVRDQGSLNGWKIYMEAYMACHAKCFIVY